MGRPKGVCTPIRVTAERRWVVARRRAEGSAVAAIGRAVGLSRTTIDRILATGEGAPS